MGFCIGVAMAGSKVLTATSGPGISLYNENIGLAIMGETPMVIVNSQRQGPAVGSATKRAEGDLRLCHEHLATPVIRSFLGAMTNAGDNTASGFAPVLLITTPDGQRHEMGTLMIALVAASKGWEALYLGTSKPARKNRNEPLR